MKFIERVDLVQVSSAFKKVFYSTIISLARLKRKCFTYTVILLSFLSHVPIATIKYIQGAGIFCNFVPRF